MLANYLTYCLHLVHRVILERHKLLVFQEADLPLHQWIVLFLRGVQDVHEDLLGAPVLLLDPQVGLTDPAYVATTHHVLQILYHGILLNCQRHITVLSRIVIFRCVKWFKNLQLLLLL